MNPAQPAPTHIAATPRARRRRRHAQSAEPNAPLVDLRRRYNIGAVVAIVVFLAAFVTDMVRDTPGDNAAIIGMEVGAAGVGVLCAFVATTIRIMTQNTEYALSIWKVASRSGATDRTPDGNNPSPQIDAIPIGYGRTVRERRRDGRIAG